MTTDIIAKLLRDDLLAVCGRGAFGLMYRYSRASNKFDTPKTIRIRNWISTLDPEQRAVVLDLMDECADMCLFRISTILDGASSISENFFFELAAFGNGKKITIASGNPTERIESLHDIVAEIQRAG